MDARPGWLDRRESLRDHPIVRDCLLVAIWLVPSAGVPAGVLLWIGASPGSAVAAGLGIGLFGGVLFLAAMGVIAREQGGFLLRSVGDDPLR